MNKKVERVEISYKTIVFTFLFAISVLVLWQIRSLIALFFVCFILAETINPAVEKLETKKISRPLAILFIYILLLVFFSFAIAGMIPSLVSQFKGFAIFLPKAVEQLNVFGVDAQYLSSQLKLFEKLPEILSKTTISIFSNIFSAIVVLMITFYMLMERGNLDKYGSDLLGKKGSIVLNKIITRIESRLAHWSKAELLLMIIVGILTYVGYMILGLNFALALGIIAAILELVPNIGPTVTTILASLVALNQSPLVLGLTIVWGILVQQLENNFIVPRIMKTKVGLNPVVTIFVLAIGAKLGGVMGTVMAIPSFLTIESILQIVIEERRIRGK